jgi:molybdenum cofactor cytidylyltransferase
MEAGLILAAGEGRRFAPDASKLLAELGGRPLLEHAVSAMCAVAELDRVVVVLGARADELLARVRFGRGEPVVCPEWEQGLAASLRCGVAALGGHARVVVALGDSPTLTPEVIRRMLAAPDGARAVYGGRPGHPAVLGAAQLARIGELRGDTGARELLGAGALVECGDLATGIDVDTWADLEEVRGAARAIV